MAVTAAEAARHLRRRAAEGAWVAEQRAVRLLGLVPSAAALLRNRYGAREVVHFGSLATGTFMERGEVDVAVRGIDAADYFAAVGDLMALFGGPVDLVRLEQAPPSLFDRIAAEGRPAKIAADDTA